MASWKKYSALGKYGCLGKVKFKETLPLLCLLSYLLFLSPPLCSCPQLGLPPYSFLSPPQSPCVSLLFLAFVSRGLLHFVRSYVPVSVHIFLHPQWLWNALNLSSPQNLLVFSVLLFFGIFPTFLDYSVPSGYFFLLTLYWYTLRKWHIRAVFSEHIFSTAIWNAAMKWDYLAVVYFFHGVWKLSRYE